MIIGYTLPNAIENIVNGVKIHTIREDQKERFKVGQTLQHATGVRTKKYKCHLENACLRVDQIFIDPRKKIVKINGVPLTDFEFQLLVVNDGFGSIQSFWEWFKQVGNYRLIQWTEFKYTL